MNYDSPQFKAALEKNLQQMKKDDPIGTFKLFTKAINEKRQQAVIDANAKAGGEDDRASESREHASHTNAHLHKIERANRFE